MAEINGQGVTEGDALQPQYTAASAGGDQFRPGRTTLLHVKNSGGSTVDVTVDVFGEAIPDVPLQASPVSVPAGGERFMGPYPPTPFRDGTDAQQLASVSYSDATNVTLAVLAVGATPEPIGLSFLQAGSLLQADTMLLA